MTRSLTFRWIALFPGMLFGVLALAACGNDDEGGPGATGGTATDEEYASSMCQAASAFVDDLFDSVLPAMMQDDQAAAEAEAARLADDIFSELVDEMRTMGVPEDVRPYHDEMVEMYSDAADRLEDGDFDALAAVEGELVYPAEIRERLRVAAGEVEACAEVEVF